MKKLDDLKEEVAQEDGYNYFENISDHLQAEYLQRANDNLLVETCISFAEWVDDLGLRQFGNGMWSRVDSLNKYTTIELLTMFLND